MTHNSIKCEINTELLQIKPPNTKKQKYFTWCDCHIQISNNIIPYNNCDIHGDKYILLYNKSRKKSYTKVNILERFDKTTNNPIKKYVNI